jgi:hypothetical protein
VSSQAVAAQVLDRIGRAGFPADLEPLAGLPDDEAHELISTLVRAVLLTRAAGQAAALTRLMRVVKAINSSGRDVRADLPEELLALPPHRLKIGARLLPLVEPARIEELVARNGSDDLALAMSRALPHLRSGGGAGPGAQDVLTNLLRQLQPDPSGSERPTRGRPSGRPPGQDSPPQQRRTAHPRLEAPDRVEPGTVFELRVGLAERPSPGVEQPGGEGMQVPATRFTLTVKLLLDGFTILGSPSTVDLVADTDDPYPYVVVRLRALDDSAFAARRKIVAAYQIGEQLLGLAFRWVSVGAEPPPDEPSTRPGRAWIIDADEADQPDVYVQVVSGNNDADPRLMWLYGSPHPQVSGSGGWVKHGLAEDAAEWSRVRFRGVQARRDKEDLTDYLRGVGKEVRALIPPELWQALHAAGTVTGTPTVLLGTADPYLPWELALLPESWGRPYGEVLGGYAAIGRWVHPGEAATPAPASRIEARRMAVVSGVYPKSRRLLEAEQEAADLTAGFGASAVDARTGTVMACLKADPAYDVVHFAVHGNFDATGTVDGILMVDGELLSPVSVRGLPPSGIRLVFLNACQLGQAQSLLGEPNGMVTSFVDIGADAVIAPLWKVDDAVAREVAASLYETLRSGGSPAEYFRRQRQESHGREGQPFGTRLAYLYFGHPRLAVTWTEEGHER